ncbi:MAG: hypothetical protein M3Z28_07845 [Candidatus Dormibacteraeota bacterium]|nr:hypothetical protein [Candidatus Dormibacteraeota bacterium]
MNEQTVIVDEPILADEAVVATPFAPPIPAQGPSAARTAAWPSMSRLTTLEEAVIASPNSVELLRNPATDYFQRFLSSTPQVAELFHENTKISAHSTVNTFMDEEALASTRRWFYATAYRPQAADLDLETAQTSGIMKRLQILPGALGRFLRRLSEPDLGELRYALDLLVVMEGRIYHLAPDSPFLWLERLILPDELELLSALTPTLPPQPRTRVEAYLFVVAAPWRYMVLQGPRGYRRTLMDAGALLRCLEQIGEKEQLSVAATVDFYDARLDGLLRLDGVERSTLAMLRLSADHRSRVES